MKLKNHHPETIIDLSELERSTVGAKSEGVGSLVN